MSALEHEPSALAVTLPDGRQIVAQAAAVSIRFERAEGGWVPILLQGIRVRSVSLDGATLFRATDLTDETVQFLPAW